MDRIERPGHRGWKCHDSQESLAWSRRAIAQAPDGRSKHIFMMSRRSGGSVPTIGLRGRARSPRRPYTAAAGLACRLAAAPRPCPDRTRPSGSRVSSVLRCRPASSWSCSAAGWVCSCTATTTLDPRDEFLTRHLRNKTLMIATLCNGGVPAAAALKRACYPGGGSWRFTSAMTDWNAHAPSFCFARLRSGRGKAQPSPKRLPRHDIVPRY